MFGYHGSILEVDLDRGETRAVPLQQTLVRHFIGGAGLSAALVYDRVTAGIDPLGGDNPLVMAVGPFTGTAIPMVSRYSVCGVSPLTGFWGEATSGGSFPFRLKASGFDAIIISGRSDKPVYLYVNDGAAEIRDAVHLWGKDSYETQTVLKEEMGERGLSVAGIGGGGEALVKYAAIMNDEGRAAGRCGMGALMGSKRLKAVAVTGGRKAELADAARVAELARQLNDSVKARSGMMRQYGTLGYMESGMVAGDVPASYFSRGMFPAAKVGGAALRQNYTVDATACLGCPMACGRRLRHFRPDAETVDGPEYETVAAFGPLCRNYDLDSIVLANHLCNRHGIDTISAGVTIAYAMHLYEQGILDEDKAGMKIEWGDGDAIVRLVEMIAGRQGIGDLLAEGALTVGRQLGADLEEVATVKGLEIPMHDARAYTGMAVSYATGSRGACHLRGDYYQVGMGARVPELGIEPRNRFKSDDQGAMAARYQDYKDLYDSLCVCKFAPMSLTTLAEALNAITGWEMSPADLATAGERSMNIKRAISNRLGVMRQDDRMPRIAVAPLPDGSTAGKSPDMERLLRDYYGQRQWDWETGRPRKEKLVALGLDDVAADLWP